jgi:hypothetical protein
VRRACELRRPERTTERNVIEALLIAKDFDLTRAASSIGYPPSLLNCYGQLFFDIQDRRDEHLFIASIVYPDTRIVEMHDAYIDTEGVGPLLKRAGHNNGLGSVLELAGLNSNARRGIDTSQLPTELESLLMRNAVLLAKNGWINSANSRGIGHAKSLIAAAKMGGNTTQRKTPGTTMGSSIRDEILRIPPANARVRQGASASPSLASPQLVPQDEE